MVLETKTSNLSYGTLSQIHPPALLHLRYSPLKSLEESIGDSSLLNVSDHVDSTRHGSRRSASAEMTQDVYQRQPLLSSKGEGWQMADGLEDAGCEDEVEIYYNSHNGNGSAVGGRGPSINMNGVSGKSMAAASGTSSSTLTADSGMVRIEMPPPLREEPKFPRETAKTLVAFLFALFSFVMTTTSLSLVHERVPDRKTYGPLPDVFLDNVPAADWGLDVSEIIIIISNTSCLLLLFFHKYRLIILRRLFLLVGVLYLMRAITMYVTVMPVASKTYVCSPKSNNTSAAIIALRSFKILLGMGLSINGQHVYCGDYIYSGHTVILTTSYLLIKEYTPRKCYLLHWAAWLASLSGVVFVLVAHGHYTVDVLIAYYVTTTLFWIYHTLANNPTLKQRGPSNYLSRLWWYRIFLYFEGNVGGVVPRRYEWPLPWPRQFLSKYPDRDS